MPKNITCSNPKCKNDIEFTQLETGEWVCQKCGTVFDTDSELKDILDQYSNSQFRQGLKSFEDVGTGDNLAGKIHRTGTYLLGSKEPEYSKIVGSKKQTKIQSLSKDERRRQTNSQKAYRIIQTFEKSIPTLNSYIKDDAHKLYDIAITKYAKKRNREQLVAACIYCSSKRFNRPIPLNEIIRILLRYTPNPTITQKRLMQKHVMGLYSELIEKLSLGTFSPNFEKNQQIQTSNIEYGLNYGCTKLFENSVIQGKIYRKSLEIYEFSHKNMIDAGKDPVSFAAAILHYTIKISGMSDYGTQAKICKTFDVSRQTIKRNLNEIMSKIGGIGAA